MIESVAELDHLRRFQWYPNNIIYFLRRREKNLVLET
jgi:hypothetical protein